MTQFEVQDLQDKVEFFERRVLNLSTTKADLLEAIKTSLSIIQAAMDADPHTSEMFTSSPLADAHDILTNAVKKEEKAESLAGERE